MLTNGGGGTTLPLAMLCDVYDCENIAPEIDPTTTTTTTTTTETTDTTTTTITTTTLEDTSEVDGNR
eukprot:UN20276